MTQTQATAEIFVTAFNALPAAEREAVLLRLLSDEDSENFMDSQLAEERRSEPSRDLGDYLSEKEKS
jgi:hypothetical protein